ncbi:MAG TPA: hypothetical protein VHS80_04630 [Chthoniobacterales bacterium]|nr:hypothetical protein [Chthoniobacterales bacterium]
MNSRILGCAALAVGLTCTGIAADQRELVAEGYRWVKIDGPYACTTEQEVQRITNHRSDAIELQMVEDLEAYYLISGTLVQVVRSDPKTGMSEIQLGGITRPLWTYTSFLSTRPIEDTYGVIETPENSGLIPGADDGLIQLPPDEPAAMPTPAPSPITPESSVPDGSSMNPELPGQTALHPR